MEHIISIPITPLDQDALVPQVGFALELLKELNSQESIPSSGPCRTSSVHPDILPIRQSKSAGGTTAFWAC